MCNVALNPECPSRDLVIILLCISLLPALFLPSTFNICWIPVEFLLKYHDGFLNDTFVWLLKVLSLQSIQRVTMNNKTFLLYRQIVIYLVSSLFFIWIMELWLLLLHDLMDLCISVNFYIIIKLLYILLNFILLLNSLSHEVKSTMASGKIQAGIMRNGTIGLMSTQDGLYYGPAD